MRAFMVQPGLGIKRIEQVEVEKPFLKKDEMLLKMLSWSLNYRDLLVADGQYGTGLPTPLIPLSDGVGEIVEIDGSVGDFKIGQRVALSFFPEWATGSISSENTKLTLGGTTQGLLAECVSCKHSQIVALPEFLSNEEGATLPCAALTAWNALCEASTPYSGKKILTLGSGGVSLFSIQFAKLLGCKVIAISRSQNNLNRMKDLGLDNGVESSSVIKWGDAIRKSVFGEVDQAIELGGASTLPQTMKATRIGGEISLIGVLGGNDKEFNPMPIIMKSLKLQGIFVGSISMFKRMNQAIESSKLKPVIDKVFKFKNAVDAFVYMSQGNHFGKICLSI